MAIELNPLQNDSQLPVMDESRDTSDRLTQLVQELDLAKTYEQKNSLPSITPHLDLATNCDQTTRVMQKSQASAQAQLGNAINSADGGKAARMIIRGADPDAIEKEAGRSLLFRAVLRQGGEDVVAAMLEGNANPNLTTHRGESPLHPAAQFRGERAMALLLGDPRTNPNIHDNGGITPLHLAVPREDESGLVALLEDERTDVNATDKEDNTALHWAARGQITDSSIERLLSHKRLAPDAINTCNIDGHTPLHWAVFSGNERFMTALLNRGADPNISSIAGKTPLHFAVYRNHFESGLETLLEDERTDVNAIDVWGNTALHWATKSLSLTAESTRKLLNCDRLALDAVNTPNQIGETPLHWAAQHGKKEIAQLLVDNGAIIGIASSTVKEEDAVELLGSLVGRLPKGAMP